MSLDKAIEDANTRGYFTSTQALADYAEVILHVKKKLEAENCPVIVFGASYGGSKSNSNKNNVYKTVGFSI